MKKQYLTIAVLALALGMTACSSKSDDKATDATTAVETTVPATTSEEDADLQDYFHGTVSAVEDKIITVADEAGTEEKFDITNAQIEGADAVEVGSQVEVLFKGVITADVSEVISVEVIEAETETENEGEGDIVISGAIEKADDNTLTLKTEDGSFTFNTKIAQKVTKDGIKAGVEAEVTYYGDLDDEEVPAVATRIVTKDAADSEDAKIYTLTGKVVEVDADHVVLDTVDPDNTLFSFAGAKAGLFDKLSVGDTATVVYEGTLTGMTSIAVGVK